ncbi:MAG: hypothetical protein RL514_922 [Verrucomicrobiota bacterium]|jgi:hypothetical protein
MKRLLLLSVAGNVLLGGWFLAMFWSRPEASSQPASALPQPSVVVTNTVPFHWRQVESASYPEYLANLRSIGCPEQTINDIISADLKSLFDARRNTARATAKAAPEVARATESIDREEQAVRQQLLSPPPLSSVPAAVRTSGARPQAPSAAPSPAASPATEDSLAGFTTQDASFAQLKQIYAGIKPSETELKLLQGLSQQFEADFGNNPTNTADPNFEKRRRAALQQTDDLLRSLIGYQRYNEYLREAVAYQQASP